MPKTTSSTPTALITGASSGFGLEFAKLFAADGFNLILTALPGSGLNKIAREIRAKYHVYVTYHYADLAIPGASAKLHAWTAKRGLTVHTLVNNAGIGLYGRFADHDLAEEQELIHLNIVALSELCHVFINDMVKHSQGRILNIASIAGLQAGPLYATYFASKGYVMLFSEALHYEYAKNNITVTAVCPGVAKTAFFERAGMREDSRLLTTYFMSPERVAREAYRGLNKGKRLVIPGKRNKFVAVGYRVFPRSVINNIAKKLIEIAAQ